MIVARVKVTGQITASPVRGIGWRAETQETQTPHRGDRA